MSIFDRESREARQTERESIKNLSFGEKLAYYEARNRAKKESAKLALVQQEYPDAHHVAFGIDRMAYIVGNWLVIEPVSLRKSQKQGGKRMNVGTLMAVKYRAAGKLKHGFIRFDQPGQPQQLNQSLDQNSSVFNENVLHFNAEHTAQFAALRDYIEGLVN